MIDPAPPEPAPRIPRIRNTRTQTLIRRDTIWQIGLPIGLALAAGIALGWLVSSAGGAGVRGSWADVSLIFLIIPVVLVGLLLLVLLGGMVWLLGRGLGELPYVFRLVQDYTALAAARVKTGADKVSGVILSIRSFTTGIGRAVRDVRQFLGLGD